MIVLRRFSHAQRCVAGLTAMGCVIAQLTLPTSVDAAGLGSSTASAGSAAPPAATAVQSFQPDLFTGRATTSIPIAVPPGRKGMQPSLALSYSSSGRNDWLGVGWSLDLGSIERSTKNGPPRYDTSDTFMFSFQGVSSDLVKIPDGTYRAKDEGLFLRFESKGVSGWEVRDKSGTRYLFGEEATAQIESAGKVFGWSLDKIIDANGNSLTITYTKDQNQLYPAQIRYTAHEPSGLAPTNQVDFILEPRPDPDVSLRSGFAVTTAKRLRAIETKATVSGVLSLAGRYDLAYAVSRVTSRSLLANITRIGSDGVTSLPPMTLAYQDAGSPTYTVTSNNPPVSRPTWNVRYANVDLGHDNHGPTNPYTQFPWMSPQIIEGPATQTMSCITISVGSDGSIQMSGCQDNEVHAWTWLYVPSTTSMSVGLTANGCDSNSSLWVEDPSGLRMVSPGGFSLSPGWSILHLTDYHEHDCFSDRLGSPIKNMVTAMSPSQFIKPQLAGDVDGNGITDLITFDAVAGTWTVSASHGSNFSPGTSWLTSFGNTSSIPVLGDWNGDGRTDIAIYANGSWQFATSSGTSFQSGTISSLSFGSGTPFTGDFNGDGLTDIGTYNNGAWSIALSTGSGFAPAGSFSINWGSSNHEPLTGDFNGDGFTDIAVVEKSSGNISVAFSNGTGFVPQPNNWINGFGANQSHTSADFNGDGLTDIAYYDKSSGQVRYAPSTATQFAATITLPITFGLTSNDDGLQVGDFNGDGLADPAIVNAITGSAQLSNSQGQTPDLLQTIANGVGGTSTIQYQPSTQCDNVCPIEKIPKLPFILPLVRQVTASDGMGQSYTTTYAYERGRYDAPSKEFRGFGHVEVRDADANVSTTEFYQDDQKKGRPFHTEFRDSNGSLWTASDQTWSSVDPYPGVSFVRLDQADSFIYDGNATFRKTRSRFAYDPYGNIVTAIDDGEPSVSGDERSTVTTYALNLSAWILKPSLVQTLDAGGAVVAQRRFTYDGASDPSTPPTQGNLTKEEEWLNVPTTQWLATSLAYDAYGNVLSVTDALNRKTTNTYDAMGTYLVKITNTLNQSRTLAYDPRFGQAISSTDQNGVTTTTAYDTLGRVTKVIGPNDTSALPTIAYQYDLSSTPPSRTVVQTRIQSGQPGVLTVYAFTDGLGRTLQTRSPAEDPTKQIVSGGVELNNRGLAVKQWAPYLDASSTSYVPMSLVSGLAPPVTYAYDPPGRVIQTTEPDGTMATVNYNNGETTTTVANRTQTKRLVDAYGRLSRVTEVASAADSYVTTYEYDTLSHLTKVTDAKGNVTRIAYDSLGRKISMDDPDMGHWSYAYDAVDNLTGQTDARGVTTTFVYDALNRVTQKSYAAPPTSAVSLPASVTYAYDNPAKLFSLGKLTAITDGSGSSGFEYDNLGRLIKESKTVDSITYTIQRTYDLPGRLVSLIYPDGDLASYTYNAQGGIATIGLQSAGSAQTTPIVTSIDYNAAGQLTKITYGNGTSTDYTYNPQTLRLDRLHTVGPSGTLQDFQYTFDPLGNVAQIQDAVHTASQTFQYDALNRLTQAQGAYGTLTYAYDPIGNMLEKEGVQMSYGLADGSKPHAVTATTASNMQPAFSLTYDANGNMLAKRPADCDLSPVSCLLSQTFSYDAENRLVGVKTAPTESVTVTFTPGWNFFSLPVIPDDASVSALFQNFSADFEQIARLAPDPRPAPPAPEFQHYIGIAKFDDFAKFEYGVGYQVYCKNPSGVTLTFTGKLPSQQLSKSLAAGWQLLPAISTKQAALSQTFGGLDADQMLAYDVTSATLKPATQVAAAQAYFVHLRTASTFAPSLPRDPITTFVYDGDGGRVKKITSAGTTTFIGQSLEKDPIGKTTKYVFAGSQRIASKDSTGALRFYHTDHLGSSNVITDSTGTLVELAEYTPYGSLSHREGSVNTPQKFTGQRLDTDTGLYFYNARYYDPQLGRFTQADTLVQAPADPQTLNRYSYVSNNPVRFVDPSGYGWFKKFIAAVAAIFVAIVVTIATDGCILCGVAAGASTYAAISSSGSEAKTGSGGAPPHTASFPSPATTNSPSLLQGADSPPEAPLLGQPPARAPPPSSWLRPLLRVAIDLSRQLANWDERTASVVEAADQTSLVEIYYRPALGKGQHMLMVYNNGQNLWELLNDNGRIHINKLEGDRVQAELDRWGKQLKGPLLVTVDPAKFGPALAAQEAREGQSYYLHFFFDNSNYAVRWAINQSITYGIGPAVPKGSLGWAPDFLGDPTK